MTRIAGLVVLLMLVAPAALAQAPELPAAPDGFVWKRLDAIKGALLMPVGWHYKEQSAKGTLAFFVTEEDIDRVGRYDTGLSLNVVRNLNTPAPDYARALVARMASQNQRLASWNAGIGLLQGAGCQLRVIQPGPVVPRRLHVLALGNAKTNTFYLFNFESPEPTWEAGWALGRRIMDRVVLDDEI